MRNSVTVRKAFTLIELLVVIAIIAILAAILFPVFAQAKEAAKKTQSLSNVKQITLSLQLYVNDSDDTTPSLGAGDYSDWLEPYIKNEGVFMDPERHDLEPGCNPATLSYTGNANQPASNTDTPSCYYTGYGYNWGPIERRGGGLLLDQQLVPGTTTNQTYIPGVSMTSIQTPADMFAFGTTYDTPRITMDITFLLCTYPGNTNHGLRYGGMWPTGFADGHAKSIKWVGGFIQGAENGKFAVPANLTMITDYCADPNYVINQGNAGNTDSIPVPDGTTCAQLPGFFQTGAGTNFTWFAN